MEQVNGCGWGKVNCQEYGTDWCTDCHESGAELRKNYPNDPQCACCGDNMIGDNALCKK